MHRIFLGLAVTSGLLLVASFVLGLEAASEVRGLRHTWHDIHFLISLVTVLTGLLVHSIVFTYFLGTGRWVKEVVRVYRLPEWVYAQAVKNKRKAFPFELASMALICLTAWMGAGSDARGWPALWHLGMASVMIAFNLGAFAAEYAAIVAQARLLLEVKDEADRLREAQGTGEAVSATGTAVGDDGPRIDPT
ncbi:MAG TPA: hypothetical protein VGZ22_20315 [Isosphaeraceae bacterium]|jgi:hypothetical protein|nr:hypothetical protein [Isosphaeraceae bacterium]